MVYRKLSKTASLPVTCHRFSSSDSAILPDDEVKRQHSVKCQVGQVHAAKAKLTLGLSFLDGISKATDNIGLELGGDVDDRRCTDEF